MAAPIQMTLRETFRGRSVNKKHKAKLYHSPAMTPTQSNFAFQSYQTKALRQITRAQEHSAIITLIQFSVICHHSLAAILVCRAPIAHQSLAVTQCQGPSHGGSYMDEGTFHIRIGLPPRIVSGDCLASASCFLDCLLFACA